MLGVLCFVSVLSRGCRCDEELSESAYLREQREFWARAGAMADAARHERSDDVLRGCSKFARILVVVVAFLVWHMAHQIRQV